MSGIIAQNSGRHTGLVKASSAGGVWNLIETLTASSDADLSFMIFIQKLKHLTKVFLLFKVQQMVEVLMA